MKIKGNYESQIGPSDVNSTFKKSLLLCSEIQHQASAQRMRKEYNFWLAMCEFVHKNSAIITDKVFLEMPIDKFNSLNRHYDAASEQHEKDYSHLYQKKGK